LETKKERKTSFSTKKHHDFKQGRRDGFLFFDDKILLLSPLVPRPLLCPQEEFQETEMLS
jgi:hypothetical protein